MKKNRKAKRMIVLLVVSLGIINLTNFAMSEAKYISSEPTAFTFKSKLTSLYKDDIKTFIIDEAKSSQTGNFEFTIGFERNNLTEDYANDIYEINIPKDCTLTNAGVGTLQSDGKTFKFNAGESKSNLSMSCPVASSANYGNDVAGYKFEVKVYEQINSGQKFLYQVGKATYDEKPVKIENPFTIKNDGDTYNNLVTKLQAYVSSLSKKKKFEMLDAEINSYIEKYISAYSGNSFSQELKGISLKLEGDSYTVTLDDNFLGYVLTYVLTEEEKENKNMYFTTTNEEKIKSIFADYLKLMFNSDEIAKINSYLSFKKVDIAKFILKNEPSSFFGIHYNHSGHIDLIDFIDFINSDETFTNSVPTGDPISDDIPGIESNISTSTPSNSSVEVPVVASQNVNFGTDFVGTISNIRNNNSIYRDRISDNLVNTIVNDGTLLNEINSKVFGEQSDYEKYYIIKDESVNKYFALKVYRLNGINYFKIEDLQVNNYSVDDLKKLINISIDNVSFSSKKMIGVSITMDVTEFVRANPEATDAQIEGLFINIKNIVDKYLRKNYLTIVDNVEVIREDDGVSVRAKLNYQAKIY